MARRQVGSNQYRERWGSDLPAPQRDLGPADPPSRMRCGELWGSRCRAWVGPPGWSHGKHPTLGMRCAQVLNPRCSPQALEHLAGDPDPWVRGRVLSRHDCPPGALETLAGDPDPWVRGRVALRPTCPPQTLQRLARDPDELVRTWVAQNPSCPPRILAVLARDPDEGVRSVAQAHPSLPPQWRVLSQL